MKDIVELAQERLEICLKCEHNIQTSHGMICEKCGCPIMKIIHSLDGYGCNEKKW